MDKSLAESTYIRAKGGQWEGSDDQYPPLFEWIGYSRVKADLDAGWMSPIRLKANAMHWTREKEHERDLLLSAEERADREREIALLERATKAAEDSAGSSIISARASTVSARWAIGAAAIAVISLGISIFR